MIINIEFTTARGYKYETMRTEFDRNYRDEELAFIFIESEEDDFNGYFEVNIRKDKQGKAISEGYVCEYASTEDSDPQTIYEDVKIEVKLHDKPKMWCVTYVGLSDSEYKANGYSEVALYATKDAAKAKLKAWRDNEIAELKEQDRDYEVLEDEDDECRISWCGHTEQIRIEIHEVELNK